MSEAEPLSYVVQQFRAVVARVLWRKESTVNNKITRNKRQLLRLASVLEDDEVSDG